MRGSGSAPDAAEVVEGPQHVVVPVVGERELEVGGVGDLTGALAAEQPALEEVLLAAAPGRDDGVRCAGRRPLVLEEPVEHVDRAVERGAHGSVLGLAVPAPVGEPFAEHALDDHVDVGAEVGAGLDRAPVDARLDLAVEVALPGVLPPPVLGDERHGAAGRVGRRVEPEDLEGLQRVHRRRPGLAGLTTGVLGGEARAAVPQPVGVLGRQERRAPPLVLDARPFGGDHVRRRLHEVALAPASGWPGPRRATSR